MLCDGWSGRYTAPAADGTHLLEKLLSADRFTGLEQFEAGLWKIADDLRAKHW